MRLLEGHFLRVVLFWNSSASFPLASFAALLAEVALVVAELPPPF